MSESSPAGAPASVDDLSLYPTLRAPATSVTVGAYSKALQEAISDLRREGYSACKAVQLCEVIINCHLQSASPLVVAATLEGVLAALIPSYPCVACTERDDDVLLKQSPVQYMSDLYSYRVQFSEPIKQFLSSSKLIDSLLDGLSSRHGVDALAIIRLLGCLGCSGRPELSKALWIDYGTRSPSVRTRDTAVLERSVDFELIMALTKLGESAEIKVHRNHLHMTLLGNFINLCSCVHGVVAAAACSETAADSSVPIMSASRILLTVYKVVFLNPLLDDWVSLSENVNMMSSRDRHLGTLYAKILDSLSDRDGIGNPLPPKVPPPTGPPISKPSWPPSRSTVTPAIPGSHPPACFVATVNIADLFKLLMSRFAVDSALKRIAVMKLVACLVDVLPPECKLHWLRFVLKVIGSPTVVHDADMHQVVSKLYRRMPVDVFRIVVEYTGMRGGNALVDDMERDEGEAVLAARAAIARASGEMAAPAVTFSSQPSRSAENKITAELEQLSKRSDVFKVLSSAFVGVHRSWFDCFSGSTRLDLTRTILNTMFAHIAENATEHIMGKQQENAKKLASLTMSVAVDTVLVGCQAGEDASLRLAPIYCWLARKATPQSMNLNVGSLIMHTMHALMREQRARSILWQDLQSNQMQETWLALINLLDGGVSCDACLEDQTIELFSRGATILDQLKRCNTNTLQLPMGTRLVHNTSIALEIVDPLLVAASEQQIGMLIEVMRIHFALMVKKMNKFTHSSASVGGERVTFQAWQRVLEKLLLLGKLTRNASVDAILGSLLRYHSIYKDKAERNTCTRGCAKEQNEHVVENMRGLLGNLVNALYSFKDMALYCSFGGQSSSCSGTSSESASRYTSLDEVTIMWEYVLENCQRLFDEEEEVARFEDTWAVRDRPSVNKLVEFVDNLLIDSQRLSFVPALVRLQSPRLLTGLLLKRPSILALLLKYARSRPTTDQIGARNFTPNGASTSSLQASVLNELRFLIPPRESNSMVRPTDDLLYSLFCSSTSKEVITKAILPIFIHVRSSDAPDPSEIEQCVVFQQGDAVLQLLLQYVTDEILRLGAEAVAEVAEWRVEAVRALIIIASYKREAPSAGLLSEIEVGRVLHRAQCALTKFRGYQTNAEKPPSKAAVENCCVLLRSLIRALLMAYYSEDQYFDSLCSVFAVEAEKTSNCSAGSNASKDHLTAFSDFVQHPVLKYEIVDPSTAPGDGNESVAESIGKRYSAFVSVNEDLLNAMLDALPASRRVDLFGGIVTVANEAIYQRNAAFVKDYFFVHVMGLHTKGGSTDIKPSDEEKEERISKFREVLGHVNAGVLSAMLVQHGFEKVFVPVLCSGATKHEVFREKIAAAAEILISKFPDESLALLEKMLNEVPPTTAESLKTTMERRRDLRSNVPQGTTPRGSLLDSIRSGRTLNRSGELDASASHLMGSISFYCERMKVVLSFLTSAGAGLVSTHPAKLQRIIANLLELCSSPVAADVTKGYLAGQLNNSCNAKKIVVDAMLRLIELCDAKHLSNFGENSSTANDNRDSLKMLHSVVELICNMGDSTSAPTFTHLLMINALCMAVSGSPATIAPEDFDEELKTSNVLEVEEIHPISPQSMTPRLLQRVVQVFAFNAGNKHSLGLAISAFGKCIKHLLSLNSTLYSMDAGDAEPSFSNGGGSAAVCNTLVDAQLSSHLTYLEVIDRGISSVILSKQAASSSPVFDKLLFVASVPCCIVRPELIERIVLKVAHHKWENSDWMLPLATLAEFSFTFEPTCGWISSEQIQVFNNAARFAMQNILSARKVTVPFSMQVIRSICDALVKRFTLYGVSGHCNTLNAVTKSPCFSESRLMILSEVSDFVFQSVPQNNESWSLDRDSETVLTALYAIATEYDFISDEDLALSVQAKADLVTRLINALVASEKRCKNAHFILSVLRQSLMCTKPCASILQPAAKRIQLRIQSQWPRVVQSVVSIYENLELQTLVSVLQPSLTEHPQLTIHVVNAAIEKFRAATMVPKLLEMVGGMINDQLLLGTISREKEIPKLMWLQELMANRDCRLLDFLMETLCTLTKSTGSMRIAGATLKIIVTVCSPSMAKVPLTLPPSKLADLVNALLQFSDMVSRHYLHVDRNQLVNTLVHVLSIIGTMCPPSVGAEPLAQRSLEVETVELVAQVLSKRVVSYESKLSYSDDKLSQSATLSTRVYDIAKEYLVLLSAGNPPPAAATYSTAV